MGKSKVGPNDRCPCGSGKKFKKCHGGAGTSDEATVERLSGTSAACDDLAESAQAAWDRDDHESAFRLAQIVFDRKHACRAWEQATHLMVDCFLERGKVATAQIFAEANIRFNDVCPKSHLQLGLALEEQGGYGGAAKCFLRAIQLVEARLGDEEISYAYVHLAQCASRARRLDMIDPFLRRWRAKPPKDAESMFYFALCLMEAGALQEAETILSKQLRDSKSVEERAQFEHELGLCALHREDIASARIAFQASLDAGGDLAHRSMSMLAVVEMKAGNVEHAVRWARNAVAMTPNDIAYRLNLAASLTGCEEYEEAIEIYGEVLKDAPDFGLIQESMAISMIEMGDIDGGLANLFALEQRGFNAPSVSANIGVALARRGKPADLKKALARHERALERATDRTQEAVIVLNMLSILAKLGRDADARLLAERPFVDWPAWAQEELAARTARLRSEDKERTIQSVIRVFGMEPAAAMLAAMMRGSTPSGRTAEHYRPDEARAPTAADAAALAALVRSAREPAAEGRTRAVADASREAVSEVIGTTVSSVGPVATSLPRRRILAIATEWESRHGGLSTFNRDLCRALVRAGHSVACAVPAATEDETRFAQSEGVALVTPPPSPGFQGSGVESLLVGVELPDGFVPEIIIGHDRKTGPHAAVLAKRFSGTYLVHMIHTRPEDIEWYKDTLGEDDAATKAEERRERQRALGERANLVVAVGPELEKAAKTLLFTASPRPPIVRLDPGFDRNERPADLPPEIHCLVLGRAEDFLLKGIDIATVAVHAVSQRRKVGALRLVVRGAPANSGADLHKRISRLAKGQLAVEVREYSPRVERLREDILSSSLLLMPSRSEGFGLVGLEAIAAGTPVLVSQRSGLAALLKEVLGDEGAQRFIVEVRDDLKPSAKEWERRIEAVLMDRAAAFARAEELRQQLLGALSWERAIAVLEAAWEPIFLQHSTP